MTERACRLCVKLHFATGHCRARPPAAGPGGHAQWPSVRPDDYCHSDFECPAQDAPTAPRRGKTDPELAR